MNENRWELHCGDSLTVLRRMDSDSVDCCITSPPYYALRDYGYDGQIGLEDTPEQYIDKLTDVFREVRRVLKPSGTCWINIGDCCCNSNGFARASEQYQRDGRNDAPANDRKLAALHNSGFKTKDLIGVPWMLAFALRADGWYLRQDIIWAKPNPMPKSVTDRCTKSHEYIFLLTKNGKYYYDADAIKTEAQPETALRYKYEFNNSELKHGAGRPSGAINTPGKKEYTGKANKRDVWNVPASGGYTDEQGGHYATYSQKLIEPCVLAGCPKGGIVLDPFNGTGTTGVCAVNNGRKYIGIDLSEDYINMATRRLERETAQYSLFEEDDT